MTNHRARAYKRVTQFISELGPAKLHAEEAEAIRDAADAMLFNSTADLGDDAAVAMRRLTSILAALVGADRVLPETAERILDAVEACGPQPEELPVAA